MYGFQWFQCLLCWSPLIRCLSSISISPAFGTQSHFNGVTVITVAVRLLDSSTLLSVCKHGAATALLNIKWRCKDRRSNERPTKQASRSLPRNRGGCLHLSRQSNFTAPNTSLLLKRRRGGTDTRCPLLLNYKYFWIFGTCTEQHLHYSNSCSYWLCY